MKWSAHGRIYIKIQVEVLIFPTNQIRKNKQGKRYYWYSLLFVYKRRVPKPLSNWISQIPPINGPQQAGNNSTGDLSAKAIIAFVIFLAVGIKSQWRHMITNTRLFKAQKISHWYHAILHEDVSRPKLSKLRIITDFPLLTTWSISCSAINNKVEYVDSLSNAEYRCQVVKYICGQLANCGD